MKLTKFNEVKTAGGPGQEPSGGDIPSLSSNLAQLMKDVYSGVNGILRKRAHQRCAKRGEDYLAYDEKVRAAQRIVKTPEAMKMLRDIVYDSNPFLAMIPKSEWQGASFQIPKPWPFGNRKKSRYRHTKYIK